MGALLLPGSRYGYCRCRRSTYNSNCTSKYKLTVWFGKMSISGETLPLKTVVVIHSYAWKHLRCHQLQNGGWMGNSSIKGECFIASLQIWVNKCKHGILINVDNYAWYPLMLSSFESWRDVKVNLCLFPEKIPVLRNSVYISTLEPKTTSVANVLFFS